MFHMSGERARELKYSIGKGFEHCSPGMSVSKKFHLNQGCFGVRADFASPDFAKRCPVIHEASSAVLSLESRRWRV